MRKVAVRLGLLWLLLLVAAATKPKNVLGEEEARQCASTEDCDSPKEFQLEQHDDSCRFYLAESKIYKGQLGLYSTFSYRPGEIVHQDFWLHIPNANVQRNDDVVWHDILLTREDIQERLRLETQYEVQSFLGGIGSTALCHDGYVNIHPLSFDNDNSASSHERRVLSYIATSPIRPGQELFTICSDDLIPQFGRPVRPATKSLSTLAWYGTCLDRLIVQEKKPQQPQDSQTTTPTTRALTRGAYSKRRVTKGQVVASSPVVLLDRSQLEIVQQSFHVEKQKMEYTEHVVGQQELLNYCFGHVNSSLLVLPYGPQVNYITTFSSQKKPPNVRLAWHNNTVLHLSRMDYLELPAIEAMDQNDGGRLIIDYIALRDISPGDEIVLDYGKDWQAAWEEHMQQDEVSKTENIQNRVVTAEEYLQMEYDKQDKEASMIFRTANEQIKEPYPNTIQTACWYQEEEEPSMDQGSQHLIWNPGTNGQACLRPCDIIRREKDDDTNANVYTVRIANRPNPLVPIECQLSEKTNGQFVFDVPSAGITLVNKPPPESSLSSSITAFRHEMRVPDNDFYPDAWYTYNRETAPMGDFTLPHLKEGQIEPIQWADTGETVTSHAYVIRVPASVRTELLKFCNRMGITERFKYLTYRGNPLRPGQDEEIELLNGSQWLIQRPLNWKSNLHWISPLNKASHREYLQALSAAGWDGVLKQIGEHFGFDGLACYHIAFISVSHSTGGLVHFDVDQTGAKAFSMIVPLILVNGTQPELALVSDKKNQEDDGTPKRKGGLKYRYEVAAMMGDAANHATSSVDYRVSKQMRMAATIYIADINKDNLDAILEETQNYPPRDRPDILWSLAGKHWKRNDPSVKLPRPDENGDATCSSTS